MHYLKLFLLSFYLIFSLNDAFAGTIEAPKLSSWSQALNFAQEQLPHEGVLIQNHEGYVYLKVDDRYIHSLYPMLNLKHEGFNEPEYFRRQNSPGAHISVFFANENVHPQEIGETFHFTPLKITIVKGGRSQYAVLQVHSSDLERLRKKYGLNPQLHGHEFHITIAKKRRSKSYVEVLDQIYHFFF